MPARRRLIAEDLYALQLVEDPQFSPDGQHIAFVKVTIDRLENRYRRNIWLTRLRGGQPPITRQFTYGSKADTTPRWSPDGQTLAFVSTRGDKPQIYLIGLNGGEARPLTAMRNGASNPVWSPDGRRIAFLASVNADERRREDLGQVEPAPTSSLEARHRKERAEDEEKQKADPRIITRLPYRSGTEFFDDRFSHIYVVDVPDDGEEVELPRPYRLTDGDMSFGEITWTGDGRFVISTQARDPEHDPWYRHDLVRVPASGPRKPFRRLTRPGYEYSQPRVSPDGQWIAALRRRDQGTFARHWRLVLLPAAGGAEQALAGGFDRNLDQLAWSPDSRYVYFMAGDQGDVGVYRVRPGGAGRVEHVVRGQRMVTGYSAGRRGQVAFSAWSPIRPADLYLAASGGRREQRLTDFNHKLLGQLELAEPEAIRYAAPDGRPLQGWLLKPAGFRPGRKYPLVVHVHGGPHLMWGPCFPGMWIEWQFHAARGYAVFFSNPRGSAGYGEAFADSIHNDWGDHVMHDILAGVEHISALGFVDKQRLALTGGSYAGYMTAWIVAHDQRFACAWAQRGLYNLLSFFGTSDIPQLIEQEFDMLPFDDVQKAWQQSPLAYVRGIDTPLAIEHQDQDYRCPVSEAEQLYAALKRLRRPVVFYRYPREGHEMSRSGEPRHRVDRLNRMVEWFDRYCGSETKKA